MIAAVVIPDIMIADIKAESELTSHVGSMRPAFLYKSRFFAFQIRLSFLRDGAAIYSIGGLH